MSGGSWPKIAVKPAPLPEHATQLRMEYEGRQAQEDLQWLYIEPFVLSVQEVTRRMMNQPGTAQIAAELCPSESSI